MLNFIDVSVLGLLRGHEALNNLSAVLCNLSVDVNLAFLNFILCKGGFIFDAGFVFTMQ